MDTSLLRSFAVLARTSLVGSVSSRLDVVVSAGSDARVVAAGAVRELESAAGGGVTGPAAVADRVAYVWFNRLVALRFMDASGVNPVGVVSPAPGGVQPEVLVQAKRGVFAPDVVSAADQGRIRGFLDGSVSSSNPDASAYGVLLSAYCRFWNRSMPFLFEREADYTELLMPQDLLADDSVRAKAVAVMSEEVCGDVEVIGWLYQFYISERKDEVFAGFKKGKKAGAAEIPAATQLFTPDWIVRYLVENSVGRLWLLNHPDSAIREQMEYYIAPVEEETDFLKISSPEELKVIDPACGSGHMLTYAFDLLHAIYEEAGYPPADIPSLILTHNLFGTEIDPRAGGLAAFALTMKARLRQRTFFSKQVHPNVCVLEPVRFTQEELDELAILHRSNPDEEAFWNLFEHADVFGALLQPNQELIAPLTEHLDNNPPQDLIAKELHERARHVLQQAEYVSQRYHVVVANPPYMDARNMGDCLDPFVRANFPLDSSGLDVVFIQRAKDLLVASSGYLAVLTMDSWLSNTESRRLRSELLNSWEIVCVLHLGKGAFAEIGGAVVSVAGSILRPATTNSVTTFVDVRDARAHGKAAAFGTVVYRRDRSWFTPFPGGVLTAYSALDSLRAAYVSGDSLEMHAEARTGLQTGDNQTFIRRWYEVAIGRTNIAGHGAPWVRYVKSTDPDRWYAREQFLLYWGTDGAAIRSHPSSVVRNSQFYFMEGVSYAGRAGELRGRLVEPGAVFDQQNSMLFVDDLPIEFVLGLVNSSAAEQLVRAASPTKFNVGAMKLLPIPAVGEYADRVTNLIAKAIGAARQCADSEETSMGFKGAVLSPGRLSDHASQHEQESLERAQLLERIGTENDRIFAEFLNVPDAPIRTYLGGRPVDGATSADLVSYAVGNMFGRFSRDREGLVLADQGDTLETFLERVPNPSFLPDRDNVIPIVEGEWFEDDIVARFREFLLVSFGEEYFEENLRFIEDTLGKSLRQYFVRDFYADHVKRYKKRPIYWMFSSPKGSFNALIYMHRYDESTVGTVLTEYLQPFRAKLEAELSRQEHLGTSAGSAREVAAATKDSNRLRKALVELADWERDVVYPLAVKQISIDLDDGVKVNYPKFGSALKKIPGLEAAE